MMNGRRFFSFVCANRHSASKLNETIERFKSESKLQDPKFGALRNLENLSQPVSRTLLQLKDPRARKLQNAVEEFVNKCESAHQKK